MGILIASKREGFRRAGVEHSCTPTLYTDNHFTEEQLEALEDEPMLIVQHVGDEPEGVKQEEVKALDVEEPKPPKGKAAAVAAVEKESPEGDA